MGEKKYIILISFVQLARKIRLVYKSLGTWK